MSDPDCIFCKIIAGELPSHRVYEDERTVAFMDIAPGNPGHLLVVPRVHAKDIREIDPADLAAVAQSAQRMVELVSERLSADGVNVINSCGAAAWQTVFHLHFHVIPRYSGDSLALPWTPTAADPDAIAQVAEKLR
jgi:histidine triad (HIT) family protein